MVLLDLLMPNMDGFALMELLRRRIPPEVFLPILVLTADTLPETRRRALALGAKDFLTKPFDSIEVMLRIWNLLETRFLYRQLESRNAQLGDQVERGMRELDAAQTEIIWRLTRAAESRDEDTGLHTQRVARISALIARALQLDDEQVELIRRAAPLHDIGKVAVPDQILRKTGRLTPEEFEVIKQHSDFGGKLLAGSRLPLLQVAHAIALHHHERWDGTGYPQALKGPAIPIAARIVAVADAFDALTHERPYKSAWPITAAVQEIVACAGTRYDPDVVEALMQVLNWDGMIAPAPSFADA
jgi:putative two-component system response regulator